LNYSHRKIQMYPHEKYCVIMEFDADEAIKNRHNSEGLQLREQVENSLVVHIRRSEGGDDILKLAPR